MKKIFYLVRLLVSKVIFLPGYTKDPKEYAVRLEDILLPAPDKTGGKRLMQTLNERRSMRSFTRDDLTIQQLSNLLWAGWGINRPADKHRTAPSSRNIQEIDIYVALAGGLYLYDAELNILKQIHNRDIRKVCGSQDFVADAPVNLVFVADMAKFGKKEGAKIKDSDLLESWANTGFIAQNIYLYCASENLGCVIRAQISKDKLAREMGLRSNLMIILSQTIGIPQIDN